MYTGVTLLRLSAMANNSPGGNERRAATRHKSYYGTKQRYCKDTRVPLDNSTENDSIPEAGSVRPVGQNNGDVAVVAFQTKEAREAACSARVCVGEHTIIGPPALGANSQIYRMALHCF
ncbi:hypothetical protein BJV82DRAFT_574793 [Fennellomyces sp. T-0311]|nr:hypothetical protein BJV82DRAFT_574793 [Fennellomyces sp. T-0311]